MRPRWRGGSSARSPASPDSRSHGYPGQNKSVRQLQASCGLLFDVFMRYDRGNLLIDQAHREVLERQLEQSRLGQTLERLLRHDPHLDIARPSPLSFPILVDRSGTASVPKSWLTASAAWSKKSTPSKPAR